MFSVTPQGTGEHSCQVFCLLSSTLQKDFSRSCLISHVKSGNSSVFLTPAGNSLGIHGPGKHPHPKGIRTAVVAVAFGTGSCQGDLFAESSCP